MRGTVANLRTPHPLGSMLPGLLQDDRFAQAFVAGLDEVLAPVFLNLDNLDAYLDPRTSPEDFLTWLAGWVGLELDETWPLDRRRLFLLRAVDLYRSRGTVVGLADHVQIFTGGTVEIIDSGAVAFSTVSGADLPGRAGAGVLVRVFVDDPESVDASALDKLVNGAKPAHAVHNVEVLKA